MLQYFPGRNIMDEKTKEIKWTPPPGTFTVIREALELFKEMVTELELDGIEIDYRELKALMDWCRDHGEETITPPEEILGYLGKYLIPAFSILDDGTDRDKLEPTVRELMEPFPEMKKQWEMYVEP